MGKKYKINTPHIVFDIIENEVIIINLKNGNYYNVVKTGTYIWQIIEKGFNPEDITGLFSKKFNILPEIIKKDIHEFIAELLMEKLISETEDPDNNEDSNKDLIPDVPEYISEYQKPKLYKYADMQNALMLDPIHEFDERTWPTINDDLYFREFENEKA